MPDVIATFVDEFQRLKKLADGAIAQLDGDRLFTPLAPHANSAAVVIKHMAGNLRSRWTDVLTTDGDKPNRDRDGEFVVGPADTREALLTARDNAWAVVFATLATLRDGDLDKVITIRGEPHTLLQALLRSTSHTAYHVGQLTYFGRALHADANWLTIAPGQSKSFRPGYLPKKE